MRSTIEYMEKAKENLNIKSDYAMAKWLGITVQAMSKYKNGERTIDDYAAAKIANALGIPAIEVIAVANAEREKDEKRRDFWKDMLSRSMAAGVMIFAVISTGYSDRAEAGITETKFNGLYIMRTWKSGAGRARNSWLRAPAPALAGVPATSRTVIQKPMARNPGP